MKVWCDSVDAAAKGKTAGTYDEVGTITLSQNAEEILGIIANVLTSGPTSGESSIPILQLDSSDLGISQQRFLLTGGATEGIATNDKEAPFISEFIPFMQSDPDKSLKNAKAKLSISTNVDYTEGWDAALGLVYADGLPNQEYYVELMTGACGKAIGGGIAESDAGISAATATAFSSGISVSSVAKELLGLSGWVLTNAPTAKEACVGWTEFQASAISNFSPQKWPFNVGFSASLGTPVGTPLNIQNRNGLYYPTRFPLPEVNFDIDVSMTLATALSNAGDGLAGARWR